MQSPSATALEATALEGSRVLVTGASGLIGNHLVRLVGPGVDVVGVSRFPRRDVNGLRWITADLAQDGVCAAVVDAERPDVLIHLAGAVRGDRTLDAVGPTLRTNLVATVELLEAATRVGCRRIVLSGSLYEEPVEVAHAVVPPSPYGASRWAASAYGRMFHELLDAPVVILRPSYAYGPGQEATKLIPHVTTALLRGESPELSSGERTLDWAYAQDVAGAYIAAASRSGIEGMTLDVGSGIEATVQEVVETLVRAVGASAGRPLFGTMPVRPHEQHVVPDVEETAEALAWRATTCLEDGLRRTVAWYRDHSSPD